MNKRTRRISARLRASAVTLVALMLSGCGTIRVTDNLRQDSPKGYAEFYLALRTKNDAQTFPLCKIEGMQSRKVGAIAPVSVWDRRRVACAPGYATFIIMSQQVEETVPFKDGVEVTVPIKEGMVTPVRVAPAKIGRTKFTNLGGGQYSSITSYHIRANSEAPIPLAEYDAYLKDNMHREKNTSRSLPDTMTVQEAMVK